MFQPAAILPLVDVVPGIIGPPGRGVR
jgi:hypothetical protein